MSLKTDYYDGTTGLQANISAAFQAGIDAVGTGITEISDLDLGDRDGSNLGVVPAGGTKASFTGQVAGLTSSVTIKANLVGTAGNVTLTGDGTSSINQLVVAWNSGHAANQAVAVTAGDDSQIASSGAQFALTGGTNDVPQAGIYFDIDGPGNGYRIWIYVSGQLPPASAGRSLVQVTVLNSDSRAQAATKIGAAIAAIVGSPFNVVVIGGSVQMETSAPKTVVNPISLSSGWGTAAASVDQVGSDSTGNYSSIRSALLSAAAAGQTKFTFTFMVTYNPSLVRGSAKCGPVTPSSPLSSCSCQSSCSCSSNNNNLIAVAYLDGITAGMADQQIYSFEVTPKLNLTDTINTQIDLCFHF